MPRPTTIIYLLAAPLLSLFCGRSMAASAETKPTSFVRDVAPILVGKCQGCHGPKTAESNYRLDTFELLLKPGDNGTPPVTAEKLEESGLYHLISAEDPHERMPNNGGRLTDAEIASIASWIREGAKFDGRNATGPLRDEIPRDLPQPIAPETYGAAIPIAAITFTPDGKQLVVGGYHELLLWDPATATRIARIGNVAQRTFGVAFSPDGAWLAVAGGAPGISGEVRLVPWTDEAKKTGGTKVLAAAEDVFFDVAFRPDGKQLAAGGADGSILVFDMPAGTQRLKIANHADWVTDLRFSPDGKKIATASRDKTAKVFDAETGKLLATYSEHKVPVRAVTFTPDGKSVISAGGSGIRIWSADDATLQGEFAGAKGEVYALLVAGDQLFAANDRSVLQFKLADRTTVRKFQQPGWIMSLASHEASHRLCAGCFDGTVADWNTEDGSVVKQFLALPVAAKAKK